MNLKDYSSFYRQSAIWADTDIRLIVKIIAQSVTTCEIVTEQRVSLITFRSIYQQAQHFESETIRNAD